MGSRSSDIRELLKKAKGNRCTVEDPGKGKKYKVTCGCALQHMTYVSKTPSGMIYVNRKLHDMRRWECWREDRE